MHRRQVMAAAAGALALAVSGKLASTRAQSEPDEQATFQIEYEGQTLSASRDFEATGLRTGALVFDFTVVEFGKEDDARKAFEEASAHFLDDLAAFRNLAFSDTAEASAPDVGDERTGLVSNATIEGTDVTFALLVSRDGKRVHIWGAIGMSDPYGDLVTVAETVFAEDREAPSAGEGTPEAYSDLLALLPTLEEVPPGFTMTEETVREAGGKD